MDSNTSITIGLLITVIGCFIGLAGWLGNRDKKIAQDSEFKGTVNAKLDMVLGIKNDFNRLTERVVVVEASTKSAHKRIDEHISSHD